MGTLTKDYLVDGARLRKEGPNIVEVVRVQFVTALSGTGDEKMEDALSTSGVPSSNDVHPTISGVYAAEFDFEPAGTDNGIIRTTYRRRVQTDGGGTGGTTIAAGVQFEMGGGLATFRINKDKNGVRISEDVGTKPYYGSADVFRPREVLRFTRAESNVYPGAISRAYKGKVNATKWPSTGDATLDAAGNWLCTEVICTTPNEGVTWSVTYEFTNEPEGWDPFVIVSDPETGVALAGASGVPVAWFDSAEFNDLGLIT